MTLRNKLIFVSFISVLVFQMINIIDIPFFREVTSEEGVIKAGVFSLVIFLGTLWAIGPKITKDGIITLLLYPALMGFIIALFLELSIFQDAIRIKDRTIGLFFLLVVGVGLYILLLTINILSVSHHKQIPLGQAARASHYIFTLVGVYFSMLILTNLEIFFVFKLIMIMFTLLYFCFSSMWNISIGLKNNTYLSLGITFVMVIVYACLSIWAIPTQIFSLILTVLIYIFLGFALEQKDYIGRAVWVEYIILVLIMAFVLSQTANWGINGSFLPFV